uniref:Colicin import membrane protein n=1 Tax=Candidatus Kentrum sp. FW TaxID=2126338 RepID=A0A450TGI8_9GAMM|nr:MAG: colicin import membrane protein [Candidatus Kentron sp. FW]VFJ66340.1 MAG: colicin import membrane protein [Candidatus Kentron sp. FW]
MFRALLDKANALFFAIVVHVVFVLVLLVSLDWSSEPAPVKPKRQEVESIQAVVVDEVKVQTELAKIKEQERKAHQAEEARLRRLEQKARAAERRRKEEERKLVAAKKKFKEEQERQRRKQAKEEKARKEAARKRKAEEKREAAEKVAREKKEEERKRGEAKQALERKLTAEKAERQRQQRLRDRYRMQYVADIKSAVERKWIRVGNTKGLRCKLKVVQIPTGEVVDVSIIKSSGNTAFDRSAVAAVFKASPLPRPRDASVFDRVIILPFSPEN